MTTDTAPDGHIFATAVVDAYVKAHFLASRDDAAGLSKILLEAQPEPEPVKIPFGCAKYMASGRLHPKIVPQMYMAGRKISLGHYPYTAEGAALASRVRAAAQAAKEAGASLDEVKRIAKETRGENLQDV